MEKIIVDTDILIDLIRNNQKTVEMVKSLEKENELGTTDMNVFELYWGAYKTRKKESEIAAVKGLLNTFFIVSTDEDSMELAAKIIVDLEHRGKKIDLRDLFVGSISLINSFKLFTYNKKHYENIEGLKLI